MSFDYEGNIEGIKITLHKVSSNTAIKMHYHDHYEIDVIEIGNCAYAVGNQLVNLSPRDICLVKQNTIHASIGSGAKISSSLEFSESYLLNFFTKQTVERITKCFEKNVIHISDSDFSLFMSCAEKLQSDTKDVFSFTQMLAILEKNMSRKSYELKNDGSKIADIIDYITENYRYIDNLDIVADKFYISKEHLCRSFKRYTGTSIIKHINILKIQSSFEFLAKESLTMAEVAEKSGFSSAANFSKTFKSVTGISPLKYSRNDKAGKNGE